MLTKDELLERFRKKMAEIDAEYLSKLSDEGRIRSLQQRGICKERTPEKWKEIGESVSHGMSNMLPEVREKWRSDLSKGVRDDYMERNLSIPSPNVTREFGAWFVGFYEGDGSVGIYEGITKNGTGITYHPSIEFAQKDADVVEYIASSLPDANLRWCSRKQVDYRHVKWGGQKRCVPILKLLSQYIITDFRLLQLNGVLKVVGLPLAVAHGLTLEWIVGFWDAEGSVSTRNMNTSSLRFSFAQKEPSILYRICEFLHLESSRVYIPVNLNEPGRVATLSMGLEDSCTKVLSDAIRKYSKVARKRTIVEAFNL